MMLICDDCKLVALEICKDCQEVWFARACGWYCQKSRAACTSCGQIRKYDWNDSPRAPDHLCVVHAREYNSYGRCEGRIKNTTLDKGKGKDNDGGKDKGKGTWQPEQAKGKGKDTDEGKGKDKGWPEPWSWHVSGDIAAEAVILARGKGKSKDNDEGKGKDKGCQPEYEDLGDEDAAPRSRDQVTSTSGDTLKAMSVKTRPLVETEPSSFRIGGPPISPPGLSLKTCKSTS